MFSIPWLNSVILLLIFLHVLKFELQNCVHELILDQICYSQELARGTLRHSPAGSATSSPGHQHLYRSQLETIRQRLQLNAIKQQEELAKLNRYECLFV